MRWGEIIGGNTLLEGATIYPSQVFKAGTEDEYHGWPSDLVTKKEIPCADCEGSGKDPYHTGRACVYCSGKGTEMEEVWNFPNLEVSYDNLRAITDMLGLEDDGDSSGMIQNKDIPDMKRRLIMLKNKGSDHLTKEPSVQQNRIVGKDEHGNTKIGMGAKMHDMGRNQAQVDRYIDKMMEILDFAQKNGLNVTWA